MSASTESPATRDRSTELVNKLLKLPDEVKTDLAKLLLDSVQHGFHSLEESERKQNDIIHARVQQLVSGNAELIDASVVIANLKRQRRDNNTEKLYPVSTTE